MRFNIIFGCAAMSLMAACGGGSTSINNTDRLAMLDGDAQDLFDTTIRDAQVTAAADLPSGRAVIYTGGALVYGGVELADDTEVRVAYIGEATLDFNFADGAVTGSADNFIDVTNPEIYGTTASGDPVAGDDVTGSLSFAGTQDDIPEAIFSIVASGDLEGPDGSNLSYDTVAGEARIYGSEAEAVFASGGADVTFDDQPGFIAYDIVVGR